VKKNVPQCAGEKKKTRKRISSDTDEHTKKVRKSVTQCTGEKLKTRNRKLTPSSDRVEHTEMVKQYSKENKKPKKVSLNPSGKKRLRKYLFQHKHANLHIDVQTYEVNVNETTTL